MIEYILENPLKKTNLLLFFENNKNPLAVVAQAIKLAAILDEEDPWNHVGLIYYSDLNNKYYCIELEGFGRNLQIKPWDLKIKNNDESIFDIFITPIVLDNDKLQKIVEQCAEYEYSTKMALGSELDFLPENENDQIRSDCVITVIRVLEKQLGIKIFSNESEITPGDFYPIVLNKLKYPKCNL